MIVNKISMVELNILSDIVTQLAKARDIYYNSIVIFSSLPIVIIMGDLYQFLPIGGCAF